MDSGTPTFLGDAQETLRAIFEGVETGILVIDPENHRIVDANSIALHLIGTSREETVGAVCHRFVCPAETGRCPVTDLGQTVDNSERVLLTGKGERRAIIKTVRPVNMGGHHYLLESFLDITDRKRAEQELEERTSYLNTLIETSPLGTLVLDRDERIQMVNSAFERLFQYGREEIVDHALRELIVPQDDESAGGSGRECLSGKNVHVISRRRRKDGTLVDVEIYGVPVMKGADVQGILALYRDITEQRRMEAELRESENRFRTAFEDAPYGMCMAALDGRFLHANAALCRMLGYSAEELPGAWQEITHPDDLERSRQIAARFSQGLDTTIEFEKRYVHKQGKTVWVHLKISAVRDAQGKTSHYITQVEDITQRKQADEAKAFLASLVESSQDAIVGTNPDGIVMSWNHGATDLYGYKPEEMIGRSALALIPPDRANTLAQTLARIRAGEKITGHETFRIRKDGSRVDVSLAVSPVFDGNGKVTGLASIARDITRRKRAEESLRASEERYRELFENAGDLVYTFDLDLRITSLNRLAEQTTGYSRQEAMKMNLRQLVDPRQWNGVERVMAELVGGHPTSKIDLDISAKDGRRMKLEMNPRLIYDEGRPVGIQAIARDITGRDVAEMELRQAQKLESVGRLAAGIAHEINTPMQFVGDNVHFLEDAFKDLLAVTGKVNGLCATEDVKPEEFSRELRQLQSDFDWGYLVEEVPKAITQTLDGVSRVVTIVRAMKEFAHPESKSMALADLNKAIQSTLTVARNELKYVADVETDLGELPSVLCSVSDMNQVFLNLLVNAAHAIGDVVKGTGEKGKIRVSTRQENETAVITIFDTGAGIPENIRDRIFDPFLRPRKSGAERGRDWRSRVRWSTDTKER